MRPDFLFAMPSTLSGVARTLDLGAMFDEYNERTNDEAQRVIEFVRRRRLTV